MRKGIKMIKIESNWMCRELLDRQPESINTNTYNWLVQSNNLTETIKKAGVSFSLNLLSQAFAKPNIDELDVFKDYSIDASHSLVRKVFSEGDKKPLIFARVIVPETTYLNYQSEFNSLGRAPIGNALLYADKNIVRKEFEYKLVVDGDPIFDELKELKQADNGVDYWARRSVFLLPKGPLLISEVFLNEMPVHPLLFY